MQRLNDVTIIDISALRMVKLQGVERSCSVVECSTWDRGAAGSSLTGITVLCPWARHINPSLVLVQPRKTSPFITERVLTSAGKGLTSWLSFVVSAVSLSLSHWYPGSGVVLDCIDSWSLHPYLLWWDVKNQTKQTNSKEFVHSECKRVNNFYHTPNINVIEILRKTRLFS